MAKPSLFSANSFTATQWSTAEQKAAFANKLLAFIEGGFSEAKFTKALYGCLCQCFGFIAEYDRDGFFATHFGSTQSKVRFLRQLTTRPSFESPEVAFCDVEREVRGIVCSKGWVAVYETRWAQETETHERALLATLQSKYQPSSPVNSQPAPARSESGIASQPEVSVATQMLQQTDAQPSLFV